MNVFSAIIPLQSPLPKVSQSYDEILKKTWEGIKKRNIDPYQIKLVHRPKSEYPNDAVSEGAGYGMLYALYCNDQEYFNKIWFEAEKYMWAGEFYNWRVDESGKAQGTGAATDAEEDIAVALIFADQLVKKKIWTLTDKTSGGVSYSDRAKSILASIKKNMIEGNNLRPGSGWGGNAFVNPGYFAPAWYKVYAEFDSTSKSIWTSLIDQCYKTLNLSPGFEKGLVPDWMVPTGGFYEKSLGYNPTGDGKWLYKDAIRVYWRLATDYLWYDEPRAKPLLQKAMKFIKEPANANFYQMDGTLATGTFELGNGIERPRAEHSHLTIAMWACASVVSGIETTEKYSDELLKYYDKGADYWGKASDENGEDTLHNEMYFDQFLAFFGASLISGVFTNLWEDLKDSDPTTPLAWVKRPSISTDNLNADKEPLKINAEFNKIARWTVTITNRNSPDESITFSGSSNKIDLSWYGLSDTGKAMQQGYYDIVVRAKNLEEPFTSQVWLGKAMSLLSNKRLLVDDFRDENLIPFFGNIWTSYLDSYDGKSGASSIKKIAVETIGTTKQICWQYLLDAGSLGYDPYAALELNMVKNANSFDMTGVDTIIITASAKQATGVSFQIVTDDIAKAGTFSYYDDSLRLTTTLQDFKIPISKMKQRFGGDMKLDLTKVTAIRIQVQQKTKSEGEIRVSKILFSGNVSKLYTAPPEYKEMGVVYKHRQQFANKLIISISASPKKVSITASRKIKSGTFQIVSVSGKTIYKAHIINCSSIHYTPVSHIVPGVYIVMLKDAVNESERFPVTILR